MGFDFPWYDISKDTVKHFSNKDKRAEKAILDAQKTHRKGKQQLRNEKELFDLTANNDHKMGFNYGRSYGRAEISLENMERTVPRLESHAPLNALGKQRYPSKRVETATARAMTELDDAKVAQEQFNSMLDAQFKSQQKELKDMLDLSNSWNPPPPPYYSR